MTNGTAIREFSIRSVPSSTYGGKYRALTPSKMLRAGRSSIRPNLTARLDELARRRLGLVLARQRRERLPIRPAFDRHLRLRRDHVCRRVPQLVRRLERADPAVLEEHDVDRLFEDGPAAPERALQFGQ